MPRHTLLACSLMFTACPVQQAIDDFFAEFGTQGDSSSGTADTSGEGSSSSTSTTNADSSSDTSTSAGTDSADASEATTDTSTSTTSSTTTTDPPSVCGNGIPEPGEECDDGNDDDLSDACTTTCHRPRLIFITSEVFNGADVNGLTGADGRCWGAAAKADIPSPENFRALLSDSTTDARDRLFPAEGPYRLVNGLQVARNLHALLNETLEHPIDTTELSTDAPNGAWTGTDLGGTAAIGSNHCQNWHSSLIADKAFYGDPESVDVRWINVPNALVNPMPCIDQNGLYCLEQE
jgi:cysteine-rich repeat protein